MVNNTHNNKLDDTVKQTLSNYEAPYDAGDWAKMESILDAAPKSGRFKWSYTMNIFIGAALLAGGYLIYKTVNVPESSEKSEIITSVPVIENKITTNVKPAAENKTQLSIPVISPPENAGIVPVATENKVKEETLLAAEKNVKKETLLSEKNINKKVEKNKNKEVEDEFNKNQHVIGMGNEPIFGDMLDSSKGIVGETQENEATKKAAKSKTEYPIGWNNFMLSNVNPDSIKNYRARIQKDSVKNN